MPTLPSPSAVSLLCSIAPVPRWLGSAPAEPAWFGPLESPFEVEVALCKSFTEFWVETRLEPLADEISNQLSQDEQETIATAIEVITASGA